MAPGITETPAASGIYQFSYGPTVPISFNIDGGATLGTSIARFIPGYLDPVMMIDQPIGYKTDSFGSQAADPTTLFGKYKRAMEVNEGTIEADRTQNIIDRYSRPPTNILLFEKTLVNTTTTASTISSSLTIIGTSFTILYTDGNAAILTDSGGYIFV